MSMYTTIHVWPWAWPCMYNMYGSTAREEKATAAAAATQLMAAASSVAPPPMCGWLRKKAGNWE